MVSFSCEACGDVLTKKKLDPHRNQCRGAVYTCLDCSTTFKGTEYRAHTSCVTEDQKYQGHLYREKLSKTAKRKSVAILEPTDQNALVPHQAYVEDAPDSENPPHAPTPPSAVRKNRDSVFDYMIDEDQPNTPKVTFSKAREEMTMKNSAPAVFSDSRASSRSGYRNNEERVHSQDYQEQGFSYGTEPVNPRPYNGVNPSFASLDFMTPAAKATKLKLEGKERPSLGHSRTNSGSGQKRKRGQTDPNVTGTDTPMTDADSQLVTVENTPTVAHSGLTGGLTKMMSEDNAAFPFPKSPPHDEHDRQRDRGRGSRRNEKLEEPGSPLKRSRYSKDDNGLGISIKGRAVKALSMVGGALLPGPEPASNKTRRRASSSDHDRNYPKPREGERRERKKHKVHRHNGTSSANIRHDHRSRRRGSDESPEAQRRKLKAIEYRKASDSGSDSEDDRKKNGSSQMVVFGAEEKHRRRCEGFLSNIPGTESEKGYSIHKALKRWHKQSDVKSSSSKAEEEQELWRGLRLRKNERGEIVVSF